ncbi:MAG: hypothetical protein JW804_02700 [Sedimentisphaerales bacterium]|nr:hypothetical protein [Sedimentisphaerales bacterium]
MAKRTKTKRKSKQAKPKRWSDQDTIVFKKIYPYVQNSYLSKHFNRSVLSIRKKAIRLGLKKDWAGGYSQPMPKPENPWTRREIETLRQMYHDNTTNEISKKLGRTPAAVQTKIGDIGLTLNPKLRSWKEKEVEFIRKNCRKMTLAQMAEKLGKTKSSVHGKLSKLRVREPELRPLKPQIGWKPKEDEFLRKHFFTWTIERIAKKLKRSVSGVKARAWKLKLLKQHRWTPAEEKKLEELLPKFSFEEIAGKLRRGIEAVIAKKKRLGLRKHRPWTEKQLAILKKFYPVESLRKLAGRLDSNPTTVANQAAKLKLRKRKAKKRTRKKKK